MNLQLWCDNCSEWLNTEPVLDKNINDLIIRHAYTPRHAAETRARIAVARLTKKIEATLNEFN